MSVNRSLAAFEPESMVGREQELAAVRAAIAGARNGHRGVVLVDGEAGMGKTALVRAALAGQDVDLVWVSGDEAELALDHGIVDQIVRARQVGPGSISLPPGPESDPVRSGTALVAMVDHLDVSSAQPLVVVVDDVQWADTVSMRALTFAARRLHGNPVVFIFTVRGEARLHVPEGLWRLADSDGVMVTVEPLARDHVGLLAEQILGEPVPAAVARRLLDHTGGSPLHLVALLDEVSAGDVLDGADLPAPRSFGTLVLDRLARCDPSVTAMVSAVCVLGGSATLATTATVAGLDEPVPVLEAAVDAGLLVAHPARASAGTPRIELAHPLIRASVFGNLAFTRRAELHRAAGRVIPGPPGMLHRVRGALGPDADLWCQAVDSARTESRSGAHGTAATLLLEAARVAPSEEDRERSLLDAVHSLLLAGRVSEAGALSDEVEAAAESPRRSFVQGHMAYVLGPRKKTREYLTEAWNAITAEAGGEEQILSLRGDQRFLATNIAAQLAIASVDRAMGEEAIRWVRFATALDLEQAALSTTGHAVASGHALVGTLVDGLVELDRLCDEAEDLGTPTIADTYFGRGVARLWMHDLDGSTADLERSLAAAGDAGSFLARETARSHLADAFYRRGRWDEAVLTAQRGASVLDDSDQEWVAYMPLVALARILGARGQSSAIECLDRAEHHAGAAGSVIGVGYTWLGRVEVGACRRDHESVVKFGDLLVLPQVPDYISAWRASFAEALVALGRIDDAAKIADELAGGLASPLQSSDAARAAVCVAAAQADWDEVDRAAKSGLALAPDLVGPYPRARLELGIGRAWRHRGERRRAATVLEDARRRFATLGAAPWLEQVDREIAALGLRPVLRSEQTAHQLTPQEQAVAQLVSKGLKNREVAAELVVSAKTVEHHLSRVYAKLGVRSRTELAHLLLRG